MTPLPDARERAQALDLGLHALVMAPAGSGKTGLLVTRMLLALATVSDPEQVVAITFTNKAAAEIRHRVLELLRAARDAAPGKHLPEAYAAAVALLAHEARAGWNLLEAPERLRAMTIDSFNAQLAAQLPLLSGLGGRMSTVDDARGLYTEAVMRLFARLEEAELPEPLRDALRRVLRLADNRIDRLIGPLGDLVAQRDQWRRHAGRIGAEWDEAEAALLRGIVEPALAEFVDALDHDCRGTLLQVLREGAAAHEILHWAAPLERWPEPVVENQAVLARIAGLLLTRSGDLRKTLDARSGFLPRQAYTARMKQLLADCQGNARLARAALALRSLPDAQYPEQLKPLQRALLLAMKHLAVHLRMVFGESGQSDFAEIALSALDALKPGGDTDNLFGDALLAADRRIRHLLVDEMQDTSEAQIELLQQLTSGWQEGDGHSLFLVGDPQQSIYAFRKAEVRLFLKLWDDRALGDNLPLQPLRLSANFRSDANVVGWFNRAFDTIFPQSPSADLGAVAFSPSVAQRAAGEGGVSTAWFGAFDDAAADAAAARAQALAAGGATVAVLGRTRAQLAPTIRAMRLRGITPACQDIDPLSSEPAVRDYIALVRALWHPADRLYWAVLLRAPFVGLSWADLLALSVDRTRLAWPERIAAALAADTPAAGAGLQEEGRTRLRRLQSVLDASAADPELRADLAERAEACWHALGGSACIAADELADVQSAMRLVRKHARGGSIADLDALDRGLEALYAEPRAGQVQVMTIHKAKGLEFDHVLLVGCNRSARAESRPLWHLKRIGDDELLAPKPPAALAEDDPAHRLYDFLNERHKAERRNETLRLLYVAATRARRSLTLYVEARLDARGMPRLANGSFARLLEPIIADSFVAPDGAAADSADRGQLLPPPLAPRLPPDYRPARDADDETMYRPQERRTLKPSESVLNAAEEKREERAADGGSLYAQLVGTLYHEALERIAHDGFDAWSDGGAARATALASGFRRLGLPEPQVESAVARVLALVAATLASDTARWLLGAKPWARNEYHLAGYHDGRWVAAVIDRCFEEADGTLWVVDYKTAAQPVDATDLEAYVAAGTEKYRAQIAEYARLLAALRPGRPVRAGLYFAEGDRFVEVA